MDRPLTVMVFVVALVAGCTGEPAAATSDRRRNPIA
jgi:hypothetical protein